MSSDHGIIYINTLSETHVRLPNLHSWTNGMKRTFGNRWFTLNDNVTKRNSKTPISHLVRFTIRYGPAGAVQVVNHARVHGDAGGHHDVLEPHTPQRLPAAHRQRQVDAPAANHFLGTDVWF